MSAFAFEDLVWVQNNTNGNVSLDELGRLLKPGERFKILFGEFVQRGGMLQLMQRGVIKAYKIVNKPKVVMNREEQEDMRIIIRTPKGGKLG